MLGTKRILYLGLDPTHYLSQGEVTHWPIIQIIPRPLSDPTVHQALSNFIHYSHLLITSKSTIAILKDYLPQLNIGLHIWAKKATLAVGQITAQHLEIHGIKPIKVAKQETAEGLIDALKQLSLEHAHVFWPHSAKARPLIKNFLVEENISHTTCVLYDPLPRWHADLPSLHIFDEIIFTSPSTVEAFLQIFGEFPSQVRLTAIGPITARFLENVQ